MPSLSLPKGRPGWLTMSNVAGAAMVIWVALAISSFVSMFVLMPRLTDNATHVRDELNETMREARHTMAVARKALVEQAVILQNIRDSVMGRQSGRLGDATSIAA